MGYQGRRKIIVEKDPETGESVAKDAVKIEFVGVTSQGLNELS